MNRSPRADVRVCWLGSVPYRPAWDLQQGLVEAVRAGRQPDTLLLLEHPHVFTQGRRGSAEHVLWDEEERARRAVELVWCDRGGDVTYHGPGQLVGYPILDLRRHGKDILAYLRTLESSLIAYLASLGIQSQAVPGLTGVWSAGEKVAAIGVKLTETVVSHGFALNLTTDLDYFGGIVPCGLAGRAATSTARLGAPAIDVREAAAAYAGHFARSFAVTVSWGARDHLWPGTATAGAEPRTLPVLG
ncbi:MAG: lipoyl(octanoyl) transferase LipB [Candidatus Dormibacteraceae bacterium]